MNKSKFIILIVLIALMSGCSSDRKVEPDSPENLAILAKFALNNQDFELLKSYFTDARKESFNVQNFSQLSDLSAPGAELRTYSYIRMNDQILLLEIIKEPKSNKYEIQDIIEVPNENNELFNRSANSK